MKTFAKISALLVVTLGLSLSLTSTLAQTLTDNFADGNDTANPPWTHSSVGGTVQTFDASTGVYRLTSTVGPFGLSYVGSFLAPTYSEFSIQMDLVEFATNAAEVFNLGARMVQINDLAGIDGYLFGWEAPSREFTIARVTDASASDITGLGARAIPLDPAKDYRLIFSGSGSTLNGKAYELDGSGNIVGAPLVDYTVTDATYASGQSGVVGYGQTPLSFGIDNVVAIPEPQVYALALLGVALLGLRRNRR